MEEINDSACPSSSPLVKVYSIKPGYCKKPSNFSVKHKCSNQSDGTYFQESVPAPDSECRICLESSADIPMIKACRCTGSAQFVHENCLRVWIKTRAEKGEVKIGCERCQTEYNYEQDEHKQFDCSQMVLKWRESKQDVLLRLLLEFTALFIFLGLIVFVAVTVNTNDDLKTKAMPSQTAMLAYVAAIVLSFLFLVLVTALFLGEFCVRNEFTIRVRRYSSPKRRSYRKSRRSIIKV